MRHISQIIRTIEESESRFSADVTTMAENDSEPLCEDNFLPRPFQVEVQRTTNGGEKLTFMEIMTASTSDELVPAKYLTITTFQDENGKITSTKIELRGQLRQNLLQDHPKLNLKADPIVFREAYRPLLHKFDQLVSDSGSWDSALRNALADLLAFLLYKEEQNLLQLRTSIGNQFVYLQLTTRLATLKLAWKSRNSLVIVLYVT